VDPLTTAVAAAATRFLVDGASKLGTQVGAVAAAAAKTLAQMVIDRLGGDPEKAKDVEQYKAEPVATQPSIETALAELLARDKAFAAQLQDVLKDYDPDSPGLKVDVGRDITGQTQIGDENIQVNNPSGPMTFNR
jgi:hypothetical protein